MSRLDKIIYEHINKFLLTEGKDRKQQARHKTKNVIRQHFNNSPMLDEPNDMTNGLPLVDYLERQVMDTWFHTRDRSDAKGFFIILEPMVARIALQCGWEQDRDDAEKLGRLTRILDYIEMMYQKGEIDIKSISLDSSYNDLNSEFGSVIDEMSKRESEELRNIDFGDLNKNYKILEGVDYATANKYGSHSYSNQPLCYTQSEDTWDNFTNNGVDKVYILLKNGWENIEEVHGESLLEQYPNSNAYDEYGLSMVFVFVDPDGNLVYSNTRWNHEAEYGNGRSVDHAFTKKDLSKLIGVFFDDIFKGYTDEELKEKGIKYISFDKVPQLLSQGVKPYEIFDEIYEIYDGKSKVCLNDKYNFINQKNFELLSPNQWFDNASIFENGFAMVLLDGDYNYINQNGEILSPNQWFDDAYSFYKGFARVRLDGRWNYIKQNGELAFPNQWFDYVDDFRDGFARVRLDGRWNYIKQNGELAFPNQWFDYVYSFYKGFAKVELDNKENYINQNGELLSPNQWFNVVRNFNEGFACVKLGGKENYINQNGDLLSPNQWFDDAYSFYKGFANVKLNGQYYKIDTSGRLYDEDGNLISESRTKTKQIIKEDFYNLFNRIR